MVHTAATNCSKAPVFAASGRRFFTLVAPVHSRPSVVFSGSCSRRVLSRPSGIRRVTASAYASQPANSAPKRKRLGFLSWFPDKQSVQLVTDAWALLYSNLWAVVVVFLAKDAAAFLLHRVAHRLTNHLAEVLFSIPISTVGNPWWIMVDAKFMEGHVGYQVLVGIFFLLCLPLNILFNTAAVSTAALVCTTRRATASRQPAVPGASFTGQGSGKVGLAECRSTSSFDGGDYSDSSSSSSSGGGASAGGVVKFQGPGFVSFRISAGKSAAENSSTDKANSDSSSSSSSSNGSSSSSKNKDKAKGSSSSSSALQPPAQAPVVPWLATAEQPQQQQQQKLPPPLGVKASLAMVKEIWSKQVAHRLKQLWAVDVYFNLWSLPLQAACLAVLPVFWTFPRLLQIQLSLPAAVLGGAQGREALERSKQLMAGFQKTYSWPFVWLIVAGRMLEVVRELALVSMPVRWWTDVIEVPLLGTAVFAAARVLLLRTQDMLPLAAYLQRTAQPARRAAI